MSEYIKKDPLIEIAEQQGHVTIDDIINEPPANVARYNTASGFCVAVRSCAVNAELYLRN